MFIRKKRKEREKIISFVEINSSLVLFSFLLEWI